MVRYIAHGLLTPILPDGASGEVGRHIAEGRCRGDVGGVGVRGGGHGSGWGGAVFINKTLLVECLKNY